ELLHQDHADPRSHVGLFFGYKVVRQPPVAVLVPRDGVGVGVGPDAGAWHLYCHWVLNDWTDRNDPARKTPPPGVVIGALGDRVGLRLNLRRPAGRPGIDLLLNDFFTQADRFTPAGPNPGREVWRRLAVEVRPRGVTVSLDGRCVGQLATSSLDPH